MLNELLPLHGVERGTLTFTFVKVRQYVSVKWELYLRIYETLFEYYLNGWASQAVLPFRLTDQNFVGILNCLMRATCLTYLNLKLQCKTTIKFQFVGPPGKLKEIKRVFPIHACNYSFVASVRYQTPYELIYHIQPSG